MFGLFKKKEKPAPKEEIQNSDISMRRSLVDVMIKYGPFLEEPLELCAVTGPVGFGVSAEDAADNSAGPWPAVLELTAWYEDDGPTQRGRAKLITAADARLLGHLRRVAPRDSMIQVKARRSQRDNNTYLMQELPTPIMDPELKAILLEQVKPVVLKVEELGEFTLSRTTGLFQGEMPWLEESVQLTFAKNGDGMTGHLKALALTLMENAAEWTEKALAAADSDGDLSVYAIDLSDDGSFAFWLGNEDDPEAVCLQGTLTGGFVRAEV